MRTLICGAGNLLLSDEGFGVHFIRYLEANYTLPEHVELLDLGTMGMLQIHRIEEADQVYLIDVVAAAGEPGTIVRYRKPDFMLQGLPLKLSPHQVGLQEMLLVSEMRGRCPADITLLGIIPARVEPGTELSPILQSRLADSAAELAAELALIKSPQRHRGHGEENGKQQGWSVSVSPSSSL